MDLRALISIEQEGTYRHASLNLPFRCLDRLAAYKRIVKYFVSINIKKKNYFDILCKSAARQMALELKLSREDFPIKQQYPLSIMHAHEILFEI